MGKGGKGNVSKGLGVVASGKAQKGKGGAPITSKASPESRDPANTSKGFGAPAITSKGSATTKGSKEQLSQLGKGAGTAVNKGKDSGKGKSKSQGAVSAKGQTLPAPSTPAKGKNTELPGTKGKRKGHGQGKKGGKTGTEVAETETSRA